MRLRNVFLFVISVAVLPAAVRAQSALGQLEEITGQKVDTFQGSSSYQPSRAATTQSSTQKTLQTSQQTQMTQMLGGMLGDMLVNALFSSHGNDAAAAAEAERQQQQAMEEQQRALQTWANAYSQRMNQMLNEQSQRRAQQDSDSLENLTSALSAPWDGRQGGTPGGLAAALTDPAPVVDLSDSKSLTPSLLRNEDGTLRKEKVTADEVLKRRQEAQARLKAMMEEDADMNKLGQRFYDLESKLSKLKQNAACLGVEGRAIAADYNQWGRQVDEAVQAALERGVSLLDGALIPKGTSAAMEKLRSNPATWNQTMESFAQLNKFTDFVNEIGDRYDTAHETLDWMAAKRNLYKDLDFLADHVGPLTTQYKLGKNIVASGLNVAQELDAWGNMNEAAGDQSLLKLQQQAVQRQMTQLIGDLQQSRIVLAQKLNVKPQDLIPVDSRNTQPVPPPCFER